MVDFRWHMATVVAIFLALGIGILVGATRIGGESITTKQEAVIGQLEAQFDQLRAQLRAETSEKAALEAQLVTARQFADSVGPWLAGDRLRGLTVLVLDGQEEPSPDLIARLRQAGAKVIRFPLTLETSAQASEEGRRLAQRLVGAESDLPPSNAVLLLPPSKPDIGVWTIFLNNFAPTLRDHGVLVVGGERQETSPSLVTVYARQQLASVDDLDQPWGLAALLLTLSGYPGHYGTKPGDDGLLPVFGK